MPRRPLTPRRPWEGRRVLLGVGGGIAAYKSVQLARDLTRLGSAVDVVLTDAAREFVGAVSFEGVTGRPVYSSLFSGGGPAAHIRLGVEAEVVCVAPATADLLASIAHGFAGDLLTTTLLATRAPVLLCPAMNDRMYAHPRTRENLERIDVTAGHLLIGPGSGPLAAEEGEGPGRMSEPDEIVEWIGRALGRGGPLDGSRVLVTSGPTREAIDPVRFVGNRSSGRMGHSVARAAWRRGAEVVLVSGPTHLPDPPGVDVVRVGSAREMYDAVQDRIAEAEVIVYAAAVADFRPAAPSERKLKRREGTPPPIELAENPDVALETRERRRESAVSVGFALETDDLLENARRKLVEKGFDLLVANDPSERGAGFEVETNRVTILSRAGEPEPLELLSKDEVAEQILDRVESLVQG